MKKMLALLLAVGAVRSFGAPVEWGILEGGGHWEGSVWTGCFLPMDGEPYEVISGVFLYPNIVINVTKTGNRATISGDPENIVTAYGDSWVRTSKEALVDASTTRNQSSYFLHGWIDGIGDDYDLRADDPIDAPYNSTFQFCLGFATAGEYVPEDYPYDPWKYVYYGWATFKYSQGTITLVDSALNTEGGGIYADTGRTTPVPEPSSAAFAVLGVALLLRRRRLPPGNPLLG